jgi:hypothetical protein
VRGDIFYWGILYNLFLDRFITGITGGATK